MGHRFSLLVVAAARFTFPAFPGLPLTGGVVGPPLALGAAVLLRWPRCLLLLLLLRLLLRLRLLLLLLMLGRTCLGLLLTRSGLSLLRRPGCALCLVLPVVRLDLDVTRLVLVLLALQYRLLL